MSLKKAEDVVISISGQGSFTPPPRRIDDITALLSTHGSADSSAVAKLKAQAEAPTPSVERGLAAWELGRYKQALEDLRASLGHGANQDINTYRGNLNLAKAEIETGNFRQGLEDLENFRRAIQGVQKITGIHSGTYANLVRVYLELGDWSQAKALADEGLAFLKNRPKGKNRMGDLWGEEGIEDLQDLILSGQGRLKEAEAHNRASVDILENKIKERPIEAINHRLRLARNLVRQERLLDAELEARQALKDALSQAGAASGKVADAAQVMGEVIAAQGRQEDAKKLAEAVLNIMTGSGFPPDSFEISKARVFLGNVLTSLNEFHAAWDQYTQAQANMKDNEYFQKKLLGSNPSAALAYIESGHGAEVIKSLEQAHEAARQRAGQENYSAAELLALKACALAKTGRLEEAAQDFSQAMPALMGRQLSETGDASRVSRLRAIVLEYIDLLDKIQGQPLERKLGLEASALAFQVAELWTGRSVRQALAANSARAAADVPGLGDLVRQEQDAGNRLQVLQGVLVNLISAPASQQIPENIKAVSAQVAELENARKALREEIARNFPKYADFVSPKPPQAETTQGLLRQGEALVIFLPGPAKLHILAQTNSGRVHLATVKVTAKDLEGQVNDLRRSLDIEPARLADIPPFDAALAAKLYATLFGPVEAEVKNAPELLVVAGGPLGRLPFPALLTAPAQPGPDQKELFDRYRGLPWLAQRSAVTVLPSVSSLVMLRTLPKADDSRKPLIGFADPYFSLDQASQAKKESGTQLASRGAKLLVRGVRGAQRGNLDSAQVEAASLEQLDRLPDTRPEILAIAQVLGANPAQDVFLGEKASRTTVMQTNLADRRIVAFATHALVPGDLDGLDQPALALSSPLVTGKPGDGLLTMDDILKLKLNADWVTLSACNTGAAQGAGAEAASGLGRAFFYAGARALLVSQWAVETTSAAKLTTGLFAAQHGQPDLSRSMALRQSMLELIKGPGLAGEAACYAHPFFWAPFGIIGDSGGGS